MFKTADSYYEAPKCLALLYIGCRNTVWLTAQKFTANPKTSVFLLFYLSEKNKTQHFLHFLMSYCKAL